MKSSAGLNSTPRDKVRALRIVSISMIAGVALFSTVIFFVNRSALPPLAADAASYRMEILAVLLAAGLLAVFFSRKRWGKKMQQARDSAGGLDEKLDIYRMALMNYMSLTEVPAFFAVIAFFLTGQAVFLLAALLPLIFMGAKLIAIKKLPEELQLSWQEGELLK